MRIKRAQLIGSVMLVTAAVAIAFTGWFVSRPEPPVRRIQPADDSKKVTGNSSEQFVRPHPPTEGYVGSQACRDCHAKICEMYESHPMSRSLATVDDAVPLEDYKRQATFEIPGRVTYRVERTKDGVIHRETKTDANGKAVYDQRVPVRFAVGSGQRGRTYLIEQDGHFFESPITWYSKRKRWDLSPGYFHTSNPRFERRVVDGCISCHAGRVNFDRTRENTYLKPPFLEQSIGCERCHGPGKDHIAYRQLNNPEQKRDPIVNPAKLEPRLREAVCYQCHLHGEQRIPRYGRSHFDFRPGQPIEGIWTEFVQGTRVGKEGRTKAVSQVQQMRSSDCFQKSNGRMGCTSCHNPHQSPTPDQRVAYYRDKCLQCHAEDKNAHCAVPMKQRSAAPTGNSCIVCHMPRLVAEDVPHTSQTDHRILRKPASGLLQVNAAPVEIFDGAATRLPAAEVKRARALFLVERAARSEDSTLANEALTLARAVESAAPDDVALLNAAGQACKILKDHANAKAYWTRALKIDPNNEDVLVNLAILAHNTGDDRAGIAYLDRFFQLNRWRANLYGRHAHMLGRVGELQRGIKSAERALAVNPTMANVHMWLADAYRTLGETEKSRYHLEQSRTLPK